MSAYCQLPFPHSDVTNGPARTGNEALEERLLSEVGVVLLEVLLAGSDKLDGDELVSFGSVRW
jgi:hypothetical protein